MKDAELKKVFDMKSIPLSDKEEVIRWRYWSVLQYPAAGATELQFFGYAYGQPVPVVGLTATKYWTNLTKPNEISAPYRFLLQKFYCNILPPAASIAGGTFFLDKQIISSNGYGVFQVASKQYQEFRLEDIPESSYWAGWGATPAAGAVLEIGSNRAKDFLIDPDMLMVNNLTFQLNVKWDALAPVSAAAQIRFIFDGLLVRPAQ